MCKKILLCVLLASLLLLTPTLAAGLAQRTSPPSGWGVMAAGGLHSMTSGYRLRGTLGQSSPVGYSCTTGYQLGAGFWPGKGLPVFGIYLPLVLRNF